MIDPNIKLNTWLDIQECFLISQKTRKWPNSIISITSYWDEILINHSTKDIEDVNVWLKELFEPRLQSNDHGFSILLADDKTQIPVELSWNEEDDSLIKPVMRPSIDSSSTIFKDYIAPELTDRELKIKSVAFHSFKGGVGRTLHAISLAKALSDKGKKVLLIDGDFEAPGITYLVKDWINIDYSYADLLASIHSDPTDKFESSIDFAVKSLANQKINNIILLPSFRTNYQQRNFEIKPEHIVKNFSDGFVLPEILSMIGEKLEVDFIITDLRAGLSELSTGMLLDPRVEKYLVSSVNSQSLEGTKLLLDVVRDFSNSINFPLPQMTVVLNNISEFYTSNRHLVDDVKNDLSNSYFGEINEIDGDSIYDLDFIESPFNPELLTLSNDFGEYFGRIEKAGIDLKFELAFSGDINGHLVDIDTKRLQLSEKAESMIYAERGTVENILWTQPLKRLAESYQTKLPNVVISGAKGAGKTLIFTYLIKSKYWRIFLEKGKYECDIDSIILPVLRPASLSGVAVENFNELRQEIASYLSIDSSILDVREYIESKLKEQLSITEWTAIWINAIAISAGFNSRSSNNNNIGSEFIDHLRTSGKKIVALFDGLEDLFQNINTNNEQESEKQAIRALIQRVPDWLAQQPNTPIGIIVLIRQDYVEYSILQNSAQFIDRYRKFELKWNMDEALKLVWHVSNKIIDADSSNVEISNNKDEIITSLFPLWGFKLGTEKSKEAYSANWILTALSDWNGQIQARDLVRFLFFASKGSLRSPAEDRILAVSSVKSAIEDCSIAKRDEISQENLVLKEIFSNLIGIADKKTPFTASELTIDQFKIKILIDNGIVYKEVPKSGIEQFHIAEIYRQGLGFSYKGRKMTKMLAFRRAIES